VETVTHEQEVVLSVVNDQDDGVIMIKHREESRFRDCERNGVFTPGKA